jgi:hypothetical protein
MSHSVELLEMERDEIFAIIKKAGPRDITLEFNSPKDDTIHGEDVERIEKLTLDFIENFQNILNSEDEEDEREEDDEEMPARFDINDNLGKVASLINDARAIAGRAVALLSRHPRDKRTNTFDRGFSELISVQGHLDQMGREMRILSGS